MSDIKIIGIDCATEEKNIGLSIGVYSNNKIKVIDVKLGEKKNLISQIMEWINEKNNSKILIAIDSPLGWPENLGKVLINHNAGIYIDEETDIIFSRGTDRCVKKYSKKPLDVGADKIARTAHKALAILNELRVKTKNPIELAWNSKQLNDISVIEVYPAATLKQHGYKFNGYKGNKEKNLLNRKEILKSIKNDIEISNELNIEQDDNTLDSVVCLIAAKDFIESNVFPVENLVEAKKEGWIWFYKKPLI